MCGRFARYSLLILKPEVYDAWLGLENQEIVRIEELLTTGYGKELKRYPVSRMVNPVGCSQKECMEPLKESDD